MNAPFHLICLVLALCLFGISAWARSIPDPSPWYGRLLSMGLLFFTLAFIIS